MLSYCMHRSLHPIHSGYTEPERTLRVLRRYRRVRLIPKIPEAANLTDFEPPELPIPEESNEEEHIPIMDNNDIINISNDRA